jgi:hypothetical protein
MVTRSYQCELYGVANVELGQMALITRDGQGEWKAGVLC